jgi:hypothetical protein
MHIGFAHIPEGEVGGLMTKNGAFALVFACLVVPFTCTAEESRLEPIETAQFQPDIFVGEMELVFGGVSHKTGTSRLCFLLAAFIFVVTALVHLTHSKTDFQSTACEPASCAASDALNGGAEEPCLACMIVKAFQTVQVILFLLLLHIAILLSGCCRPPKSQFHSIRILSCLRVRGPPAFARPS